MEVESFFMYIKRLSIVSDSTNWARVSIKSHIETVYRELLTTCLALFFEHTSVPNLYCCRNASE
jgi:hypothetical protein